MLNRTFELAPWADALYACDFKFWDAYPSAAYFRGLKITQDQRVVDRWPDVKRVRLTGDNRICMRPGLIGGGGNSGFQALNLVLQFGARRVFLLGFDMSVESGVHWHGRHPDGLANPKNDTCATWRGHLQTAAPIIAGLGVEVINASRRSALTAFRRMTVDDVLKLPSP